MTSENMPMEHFDKYKEVTSLLESCFRKFRQAPSKRETESIVALLSARLKLKEVITYLDGLHLKYQTFPFMGEIEKDIVLIERARKYQYTEKTWVKQKDQPWVSTQAAGTPAQAEALFNLIKKGATKGTGFDLLRKCKLFGNLTDKQVWDCYDAWCKGEIHDSLKLLIDDPFA